MKEYVKLVKNNEATTLYLENNQIGVEGAKALANALRINTSVTTLELGYHSKIGHEGAKALANSLRINTSVTTLHLRDNQIGDEGAKTLANALKINTTVNFYQSCTFRFNNHFF